MSQSRVIWISKRRLIELAAFALIVLAGLLIASRNLSLGGPDADLLGPAQRVAKGLATRDIYLHPDAYKDDLTWAAYQQVLAAAPQYQQQNSVEPFNLSVSKYGAQFVFDQGVFGASASALVEVFAKNPLGTVTLTEYQFQMTPNGSAWQVASVTTLNRGEVGGK
jgi:hypothetical protein